MMRRIEAGEVGERWNGESGVRRRNRRGKTLVPHRSRAHAKENVIAVVRAGR
jgi:hypothetical protein